jgi:RNA polymerase sigma-70 factor (ECF subfamily)
LPTTEAVPVQPADASDQPDDLDLLRRASGGDGKAFHVLVDRHVQRLYRLATSLVGNASDAEDVLQEALAGAYRGLGRFEGRSSVKTWLTRILVTQAAKWRRDRRRMGEVIPHAAPHEEPVVRGASEGVDHRIDLQAALQKLSPEHREVLTLREFDGLAYEEIAEVLGVPRGTVESRLHRARAELKDKLKAYLP